MKRIGICCLVGLLAGLAVAVPSAGPAGDERALTAGELAGIHGACCKTDYLTSTVCSTTKNSPVPSAIAGTTACGVAKEFSGNAVNVCSGEKGSGYCVTVGKVDCRRKVNYVQSEPWFSQCSESGGTCEPSLTTNSVICQPATAGPWFQVDNQSCAS